jgi:hypothetical protein
MTSRSLGLGCSATAILAAAATVSAGTSATRLGIARGRLGTALWGCGGSTLGTPFAFAALLSFGLVKSGQTLLANHIAEGGVHLFHLFFQFI